MIQPVRLMVLSPEAELASWLGQALDPERFSVTDVRPGPDLVEAVRTIRPDIAVVNRVDERPHAAQLEIALLKDRCPDVQVIAVSGRSSESDGRLVEQGIFYYLSTPEWKELPRLIEAATVPATRIRQRSTGE